MKNATYILTYILLLLFSLPSAARMHASEDLRVQQGQQARRADQGRYLFGQLYSHEFIAKYPRHCFQSANETFASLDCVQVRGNFFTRNCTTPPSNCFIKGGLSQAYEAADQDVHFWEKLRNGKIKAAIDASLAKKNYKMSELQPFVDHICFTNSISAEEQPKCGHVYQSLAAKYPSLFPKEAAVDQKDIQMVYTSLSALDSAEKKAARIKDKNTVSFFGYAIDSSPNEPADGFPHRNDIGR